MAARVTRSSSRLAGVTRADTVGNPVTKIASQSKKATGKRLSEAELEEGYYGRPDATSMPPPAKPPAKRARKATKAEPAVPSTPTPSKAKELNQILSPAEQLNGSSVPINRPADPSATNATLATPRGSRHTAYSNTGAPPSYAPRARTDTKHLLSQACEHLCKVDPRMKPLIEAHPCPLFTPEALAEPVDPFKALVSSILGQQVSGAAAASIRRKFVALFNEGIEESDLHKFPMPSQVIQLDVPTLRTAGLSQRKAEYVSGLAEKFVSGELSAELLAKASWDEVMEKLIAVRGLGVWSVQMFGCFALKRMDIFATGDLGVQRGLAAFVGRDIKKLKNKEGKWKYMTEQEMLDNSAKFAPYRSLFMWYMWRVEDVDISVMNNN